MIRSILSLFFSFLLGVVFFATFVFYTVFSTILSPDFYSDVSVKAYDGSIKVLTALLYSSSPAIQNRLTISDFERSIRSEISPSDINETFDNFINKISNPVFDDDGKAIVAFDYSNLLDKVFNSNVITNGISSFEVFELDKQMFINTGSLKTIFYLLIVLQIFLILVIAILSFGHWYDVISAVSFPILSVSIVSAMTIFVLCRYFPNMEEAISDSLKADSFLSALSKDDILIFLNFIQDVIWMITKKGLIFLGISGGISFVLYFTGRLRKML